MASRLVKRQSQPRSAAHWLISSPKEPSPAPKSDVQWADPTPAPTTKPAKPVVEPDGFEDEVDETPEVDEGVPEPLETDDDVDPAEAGPAAPVDDLGVDFAEEEELEEEDAHAVADGAEGGAEGGGGLALAGAGVD